MKKRPSIRKPLTIQEQEARIKKIANRDALLMVVGILLFAALVVLVFCLVVEHFDNGPAKH